MKHVVAIWCTLLVGSPALAGELALNDAEKALGIPFVQKRVIKPEHKSFSFYGPPERSYRNPDHTGDWRAELCYILYWRAETGKAFEGKIIERDALRAIAKILLEDETDIKAENKDEYKAQPGLRHSIQMEIEEHGLSACDG